MNDGYLTQDRAPILEALTKMKAARLVPFDVPRHERGLSKILAAEKFFEEIKI